MIILNSIYILHFAYYPYYIYSVYTVVKGVVYNVLNLRLLVVEIFENSGVQCLTFQHRAFIWYKGFAAMDYELIRNQYNRIKKRRNNIPIIFHPNIKSRNIEAYYTEKDYPYNKNKCFYPWFVLFIQPDGNIIPCDEIDVTIGNTKTESLKVLWNNAEYVNFRKSILVNGISHSICNRCDHREY